MNQKSVLYEIGFYTFTQKVNYHDDLRMNDLREMALQSTINKKQNDMTLYVTKSAK